MAEDPTQSVTCFRAPKSFLPKPIFPIHQPIIKNLQTPSIKNLLGAHWDLWQHKCQRHHQIAMQKALFLNLHLGYLLTPFLLGRGTEIPQFADSNSPSSCLLTFTICFHLQEGELHPLDSISRLGCVSFGQALSCFILGTGRDLFHQLLNNNTPVSKAGAGGCRGTCLALIISGCHGDAGMTSWFILA